MKEYFNTVSVLVQTTGEMRTWERVCTKRGLLKHINSRIKKWGYEKDECLIQIISQRTVKEELEHSKRELVKLQHECACNDLARMGLIAHYAARVQNCMYMLGIYNFDEMENVK